MTMETSTMPAIDRFDDALTQLEVLLADLRDDAAEPDAGTLDDGLVLVPSSSEDAIQAA